MFVFFSLAICSIFGMKFTVVCTDLDTGKPVYHECPNGDVEDIEWMRASASIPIASRPVKLGGKRLLDGGVSDPIPVKWMLSRGYEKNVVVLTRDVKYRKKSLNPKMQLFSEAVLHKYPAFLKDLEERHIHYNETLEELASLEKGSRSYHPSSSPIQAAMIERDESNLERIYQTGRADMKKDLEKLKAYLDS